MELEEGRRRLQQSVTTHVVAHEHWAGMWLLNVSHVCGHADVAVHWTFRITNFLLGDSRSFSTEETGATTQD